MTTVPQTIDSKQSLGAAEELMRRLGVRHLPVVAGQKVLGIVSERDMTMYRGLLTGEDADNALVEDICQSADNLTVSPFAPLGDVVADMAERRLDSAVVVDNGKVVGIFTAVDAMVALTEILNARFKA